MAKRIFDIVISLIGFVVLLPVLAVLAIAVRSSMGSPVLFAQMRTARGGGEFRLKKFRSMVDAYDADGNPFPDAERVTPLGRFLRRSRLDELPELWLVLTGDMSFVGPRPLPRRFLDEFGVREERSRTRPGLTGLSQVSGNTLLSQEEKFAIDLYYNSRRTMLMDLRIIAATVGVVINGERRNTDMINKAMAHAKRIDRRG